MRSAPIVMAIICIAFILCQSPAWGQVELQSKGEYTVDGLNMKPIGSNRNWYIRGEDVFFVAINSKTNEKHDLWLATSFLSFGVSSRVLINNNDIAGANYNSVQDNGVALYDLRNPGSGNSHRPTWDIKGDEYEFGRHFFIHDERKLVGIGHEHEVTIYELGDGNHVEVQSIRNEDQVVLSIDSSGDFMVVNYGENFELFAWKDGIYESVLKQNYDTFKDIRFNFNETDIYITDTHNDHLYITLKECIYIVDKKTYKVMEVQLLARNLPTNNRIHFGNWYSDGDYWANGEFAVYKILFWDPADSQNNAVNELWGYVLHIPSGHWIARFRFNHQRWRDEYRDGLRFSAPCFAKATVAVDDAGDIVVRSTENEMVVGPFNNIVSSRDFINEYRLPMHQVSVKKNSEKGGVFIYGPTKFGEGSDLAVVATASEKYMIKSMTIDGKKIKKANAKGSWLVELKDVRNDVDVNVTFAKAPESVMKTRKYSQLLTQDRSSVNMFWIKDKSGSLKLRYVIPGIYIGFTDEWMHVYDVGRHKESKSRRLLPYGFPK